MKRGMLRPGLWTWFLVLVAAAGYWHVSHNQDTTAFGFSWPGQPAVKIRGIMRGSGNNAPVALLEVKGGTVLRVREDDQIELPGWFETTTVRILEIGRATILIQTGSGERVVLR